MVPHGGLSGISAHVTNYRNSLKSNDIQLEIFFQNGDRISIKISEIIEKVSTLTSYCVTIN